MTQAPSFAELTGALPKGMGAVDSRAIGLPEANARLHQQMQYWLEHDGAEATAAAPGAKAAERTRRYVQHLADRGSEAAPRCPRQLQLHEARLALRADAVAPADDGAQQQQQPHAYVAYGALTHEEQVQFATLAPVSYEEAVEYIPSLRRFQVSEVEGLLQILR